MFGNKFVQNLCHCVNFCTDVFSAFMTVPGLDLKLVKGLLSSTVTMWTLYLIIAGAFAGFHQIEISKIGRGLECHAKLEPYMLKEEDFPSTEVLLPRWQLSWMTVDAEEGDPYSFSFPVLWFTYIKELLFSCNGYVTQMSVSL